MIRAKLDKNGHEIVDSRPMAPPVGYKAAPTLVEQIRTMVKSELLRKEVEAEGKESFEEADDFDVDDESFDPSSPYEEVFEPPVAPTPPAKPSGPEAPDSRVEQPGDPIAAETVDRTHS